MKKITALMVLVLATVISCTVISADPAKNIILLISDGWGYNHILATEYYNNGAANTAPYAKFPIYTAMSTWQVETDENGNQFVHGYKGSEAKSNFDYIGSYYTDSAAAVTAMSSGNKSYGGAIGVNAKGEKVKLITEYAQELGKATGNISSVEFSHATPAGFGAHNTYRNNYYHLAQEQLIESKLTVLMGAGHPYYDDNGNPSDKMSGKYVGGVSVYEGIKAGKTEIEWSYTDTDGLTGEKTSLNGKTTVQDIDGDGSPDAWTLIEDKADFQSLMSGDTPKRVFGLAKVNATLQYNRSTQAAAKNAWNPEAFIIQKVLDPEVAAKAAYDDIDDVTIAAYADPFNENIPTLEEMTKVALNVLDNDPDGFFLHVEGGAVDWAGHGNWLGRMIEEQTDFDNAVNAVIAWVETNSNWNETLVIVTGDHETGLLTGPTGKTSGKYYEPVTNNGKNNMPGGIFHSGQHTNQLIPLYAKGPSSNLFNSYSDQKDPVRGVYMDNTELFKVMKAALIGDPTAIGSDTPKEYALVSNYPNPFNPVTTINYSVPLVGTVNVSIYDMLGQKITTLVDQVKAPGNYSVTWDASDLASGTYICKVQLYGSKTVTAKMTLMK
ncbi:MAG: alkaline phosphatase [Candidatus Latescibacteria bacterium]|nr:alkaline phosphatase [Candidatus Latescibacterota bacterium]